MGFQSTVNIYSALGVPGDLAFDGPIRSAPYTLNSSGTANYIGYAYTVSDGANPDPSGNSPYAGTARVGGTGVFAGILVNSKEYASFGGDDGPLSPTLALPDYSTGELLTMGYVFVELPGPADVGDQVFYNTTSGALGSLSPKFVGTAAISATTMTVSARAAGNTGLLGLGSVITGPNVTPGTTITALGTGTGSAGTYTVSVSQTAAASAISSPTAPASGMLAIPNCVVDRFDIDAVSPTGLAVIKLTN